MFISVQKGSERNSLQMGLALSFLSLPQLNPDTPKKAPGLTEDQAESLRILFSFTEP